MKSKYKGAIKEARSIFKSNYQHKIPLIVTIYQVLRTDYHLEPNERKNKKSSILGSLIFLILYLKYKPSGFKWLCFTTCLTDESLEWPNKIKKKS